MIRILALLCLASPAVADVQCLPRAAGLRSLADTFHEVRRGIGMTPQGLVMEQWASAAGTWTITVTTPQGAMCIVAFGTAFEAVDEKLPAPGVPG